MEYIKLRNDGQEILRTLFLNVSAIYQKAINITVLPCD